MSEKDQERERVALIRKGNEFFNKGEIEKALALFVKTDYKDGLTRVADHFFYDKKMPLIAVKYYKMANRKDKVNEIFERMIFALGKWIGEDKIKDAPPEPKLKLPPLKVSPKLKILAEEILRNEEERIKKEKS